MSVYNRQMFRGPRPMQPEQAKAMDVGITTVMADMARGVKAAKTHEKAINAFRGDEKPMAERRRELGGIVGMKDANKTPESVVTLVQPVMEMQSATNKVDQGIGQVAQQAMNTPVQGKMAGGIVQPLQMKAGGAARLAELYKQNMPVVQDMFGDQSAALKKQALGQLLLGGVAPAGLAIAQGTPVSEALMQLGPYAAQLGAGVQQSKMKQDAAARQAALNLASSQQAAEVAAQTAANAPFTLGENQTRFGPKDPVTGKATVLAEGPKKIEYVEVFEKSTGDKVMMPRGDYLQQRQYYNLEAPKTIDVYRVDDPAKKIRIDLEEYRKNPQDYTLDSEFVDVYRVSDNVGVKIPLGVYNANRKLYRTDKADTDQKPVLNQDTGKTQFATNEQIAANESLVPIPKNQEKKPVLNLATGKQVFATDAEIDASDGNLVPIPKQETKPSVYFDKETGRNELVSAANYNADPGRYGPKQKEPDTNLKEVYSTVDGHDVLRPNSVILKDIEEGTGLFGPKRGTSKVEQLTVSRARGELTSVAQSIVEGANDQDTLNRFDQLMSTIMSKPGFNLAAPGQEGGYFISENPVVPRIALQAIEKIREFDQAFPDYGLLTGETPAVDLELVQIVDDLTDFSDANLGARGILKRSFDAVKIPVQNLLFGRSAPTFEDAYKVKATVQALNNYAEQAYLSLPGKQTQAQVDAFKATLPVVDSIVMSPKQVADTAYRTANQFKNKASLAEKELAAIEPSAGNSRKRASLQKQIAEITYMEDAYRTLGNLLLNKPGAGEETTGTNESMDSIFDFDKEE